MKSTCPITVQSLRRQGYKVRVIHRRDYISYDTVTRMTAKEAEIAASIYNYRLDSFGGHTRIEITTPDNKELVGEAYCNPTDQFNRKLAVRIALGRALKYYHV